MAQLKPWQQFEEDTAEIFRLFGYDVEVNTKINGAQTDLFAQSFNKFKPNILIECKYHDNPERKVTIDEIENFQSRVIVLRNQGKIDQGYLITNTDFTPSAKDAGAATLNYVFLSRFKELISQLIDVDHYLKEYVRNYEKNHLAQYVNLQCVDIRYMLEFDYSYRPAAHNKSATVLDIADEREWLSLQHYAGRKSVGKPPVYDYDAYALDFVGKPDRRLAILLADFGGGKSTSLSHLMYLLAKKKLDSPHDPNLRIPLLLTLKNYNKVPDVTSLLIGFFATELGVSNLNVAVFNKMNEMGLFVLLLDGFDEMSRLVTRAERRLTFIEICTLLNEKSKLVLASRPGYFPDNQEFSEILQSAFSKHVTEGPYCGIRLPAGCHIACLQLMNPQIADEYLSKKFAPNEQEIREMLSIPYLRSQMFRPVLLNIISETYHDLKHLDPQDITIKLLYDLYTKKWTDREEDKGLFRILIDRNQKQDFLVLLAIQLHEEQQSSIHFSKLSGFIQRHFSLTNPRDIDHFSHDIRTCSFLNRDDNGNYSFIHKSFQEYFIAKGFCMISPPIYTGKFNVPFNEEIQNFIEFEPDFKSFPLLKEKIILTKNRVVRSQQYEIAAKVRDMQTRLLHKLQEHWPDIKKISSEIMDIENEVNLLISQFEKTSPKEKS